MCRIGILLHGYRVAAVQKVVHFVKLGSDHLERLQQKLFNISSSMKFK
jgi:hypothetical protein